MELKLERKWKTAAATIGELAIDNRFQCFVLEDTIRVTKVYGQTAIAAGRYQVVITFSNRFKQEMPLLLNVPNFEGIRIHMGNTPEDTQGCLLLGESRGINFVGQSRVAYSKFLAKLRIGLKAGPVFITIT